MNSITDSVKKLHLKKDTFALVDSKDYYKILKYKWEYSSKGYVYRRYYDLTGKRRMIFLHKQIINPKLNEVVDHINHNKLDNRRINLRSCSVSQNCKNIKIKEGKRYKGVFKVRGIDKSRGGNEWKAQICNNRKIIYLGTYPTEKMAAIAYNKAALIYHGEFSFLNKI